MNLDENVFVLFLFLQVHFTLSYFLLLQHVTFLTACFPPCALLMPFLGVLWDLDHLLGDPHTPSAAAHARVILLNGL